MESTPPIDPQDPLTQPTDAGELPELALSDADILDAMRQIAGYIDISTTDFRAIYHLAHARALARLFGAVTAGRLMRTGIAPLNPELPMDAAADAMARQGLKGLPVVDSQGAVIGMLTETDFLRRLGAATLLELLLRLIEDLQGFSHPWGRVAVRDAMTAPAISVTESADFAAIVAAFQRHPGRSMPVVDGHGQLRGLLLRKGFLAAFHLEDLF